MTSRDGRLVSLVLALLGAMTIPSRGLSQHDRPEFDILHAPSGMRFPVFVGDYYRIDSELFDRQGYEMSVHYISSSSDVRLTVFVFPLTTETGHCSWTLESHFDGARRAILERHVVHSILESVAPAPPFGGEPGLAFEAHMLRARSGEEVEFSTGLYVYRRAWWFIKIRVTHPAALDPAWPHVLEFMQGLEWPDFSLIEPRGISFDELLPGETAMDFCAQFHTRDH